MASLPLRQKPPHFTWQDYQTWTGDERWELIDGQAYAMAPALTLGHQSVAGNVFGQLFQRLKGKPCRPFFSPIDVKLSELDVVQPDVLVVCDAEKITPTHIAGAPDLVIEVLSPTTAARDQREKKALYERAGVKEYVLLHPQDHYALRFLRNSESGLYDRGSLFAADESLVLSTLGDAEFKLWEIFDLPHPLPTNPGPEL